MVSIHSHLQKKITQSSYFQAQNHIFQILIQFNHTQVSKSKTGHATANVNNLTVVVSYQEQSQPNGSCLEALSRNSV